MEHNRLKPTNKGDSKIFVEWFPEQLQLSRQIQGCVKGRAYFSGRSLKQGVWGHSPPEAIGLLHF